MKTLTVCQPYADLIDHGEKWVENRTWPTSYRGPLAIHAGKSTRYLSCKEIGQYRTGVIVCTCELMACVRLAGMQALAAGRFAPEDEPDFLRLGWKRGDALAITMHKHAEGPWLWVLGNIRPIRPRVAARGKQGLWNWDRRENR